MKKLKVFVAMLSIALVSCGEGEKKEGKEHNDKDGHVEHRGPKHGHGDHDGPRHGHGKHDGPKGKKGHHKGGLPFQTKTLEEIGGYQIGDIATDFSLKNVDESMVSLASYENAKGYVVVFTCNECPFSKMYEDRLIELHNSYTTKGYPVIAINPNSPENELEDFSAMQKRAKEKSFPFPYLYDEAQEIYSKYGAVRTPHVFLLDKDLKVQYIGAIDDNPKSAEEVKVKYLENAIEALEKNEKPDPNFTKAIGCPVKGGSH